MTEPVPSTRPAETGRVVSGPGRLVLCCERLEAWLRYTRESDPRWGAVAVWVRFPGARRPGPGLSA